MNINNIYTRKTGVTWHSWKFIFGRWFPHCLVPTIHRFHTTQAISALVNIAHSTFCCPFRHPDSGYHTGNKRERSVNGSVLGLNMVHQEQKVCGMIQKALLCSSTFALSHSASAKLNSPTGVMEILGPSSPAGDWPSVVIAAHTDKASSLLITPTSLSHNHYYHQPQPNEETITSICSSSKSLSLFFSVSLPYNVLVLIVSLGYHLLKPHSLVHDG